MAVSNEDLERVRNQLEMKINSVNVENMNLAQSQSVMERRFDGIEFRLDALSADMDRRFDDVRGDVARLDGRIDRLESRFDARIDRLDSKLDARFNVQTVLMTVLGVIVLFGDPIRELLGV